MKRIVSIGLLAAMVSTGRAQILEKKSPPPGDARQAIVSSDAPGSPAAAAPVVYFDSAKVSAAFGKGQTLLATPSYKVAANRREKLGLVEIHTRETDVFYIVEGAATFITGGTAADAKVTTPGQLRGTAITGGETHHLKKGDVIIVPAGVPHQFTEVSGPFLYFTVKSIRGER